ncbi:MAG: transposase [Chloroflexota bacterium]|nr:transposase [Chloroflexota bacterium]
MPAATTADPSPADRHKGWHSRGYLPHCDVPGLIQFITFRLGDSLPSEVTARLLAEKTAGSQRSDRLEELLHAGHGHCWLARDDFAALVQDSLLHFDGQRYQLLAWCVMPNHVHVLVETREGYPLGEVVHSWKSFTAKQINQRLSRSGGMWAADYYDRYIRNDAHLQAAMDYIESNPVKAGLAKRPDEWRFSSAAVRL